MIWTKAVLPRSNIERSFFSLLVGNMSVQEFYAKNRVGHHKPWESGKYTAKDAYPDLSKHNNVMATHLTLPVSDFLLILCNFSAL